MDTVLLVCWDLSLADQAVEELLVVDRVVGFALDFYHPLHAADTVPQDAYFFVGLWMAHVGKLCIDRTSYIWTFTKDKQIDRVN